MRRNLLLLIIIFLLATGFLLVFLFFGREPNKSLLQIINKPQTPTTSFLVFGDSGTGSTKQKELAKVMLDYQFDFILHTGDVAYPEGAEKQLKDNFFSIYKNHLEKGPIYPSPGNHDYLTNNLSPYLSSFELPKQALKEKDNERYYSFDKNNIHIISLDTNTPLNEVSNKADDDMLDWLTGDLEKATAEWKIVFFHHAPYSSGKEHGGDKRVKNILVPIFEKYGIDIVFSGHEHNYERTCKLSNDVCSDSGVTYIVTGGGGGPIYEFGDLKNFTASRAAKYHFINSNITGCRLKTEVVGIGQEIIDSFSIDKC